MFCFLSLSVSHLAEAELVSAPYGACFDALEKRIQSYCNCSIQDGTYLILTSKSGLRARVDIDTTANGLPDVAWVLNQINRSGHPGRMKSFVDEEDKKNPRWVIKETIRKWDLENTKDGLSMGTPQKITKSYKFSFDKGDCKFDSLEVSVEEKKKTSKEILNSQICATMADGKDRTPASIHAQIFKKECESVSQLDSKD